MEGWHRLWSPFGTEEVVRKDRKVVTEEMAQARWAPKEVVARPLETPMGEKPRWQKSNPGKEEAGVASERWLSRGKPESCFPHDTETPSRRRAR